MSNIYLTYCLSWLGLEVTNFRITGLLRSMVSDGKINDLIFNLKITSSQDGGGTGQSDLQKPKWQVFPAFVRPDS